MRVFLVTNPDRPRVKQGMEDLLEFMRGRCELVGIDGDGKTDLATVEADSIVMFGGDGTLLSCARRLKGRSIPLMGVNFGRLGFLASFTPAQFKAHFDDLVKGQLPISSRQMISSSLVAAGVDCNLLDARELAEKRRWHATALNDAVVTAGAPFRMIELLVGTDSDPAVRYFGDGMIVSTASGSTAYNISAGGPIISPNVDALCVTPICPHSLSFRPIVIRSSSRVILTARRVNPGTTLFCDGQESTGVQAGDRMVIQRAERDVLLVENPDAREWRTLAEKLNWASSPRYNSISDKPAR
jgi:NAD+ kinase